MSLKLTIASGDWPPIATRSITNPPGAIQNRSNSRPRRSSMSPFWRPSALRGVPTTSVASDSASVRACRSTRTARAPARVGRRRRSAGTGARAGSRPRRRSLLNGFALVEADLVDPEVDPAAVPGEADDRHRCEIESGRALRPALLRHLVERHRVELPVAGQVHDARPVVTALLGRLGRPFARRG